MLLPWRCSIERCLRTVIPISTCHIQSHSQRRRYAINLRLSNCIYDVVGLARLLLRLLSCASPLTTPTPLATARDWVVCAISNRDDHKLELDFSLVRYPRPRRQQRAHTLSRLISSAENRRENGRTSGRDSTYSQRCGMAAPRTPRCQKGLVSGRTLMRRAARCALSTLTL